MSEPNIPKLESLASQFDQILRSPSEQDIHTFLELNLDLLGFTHWDGFIKSKFRLADQYVPDFMIVGLEPYGNSPRPLITFVEIERATESLFTKAGDPSSFLSHAVRQVQDWKRWVSDNRTYLQTELHRVILEESSNRTSIVDRPSWRRDNIERTISYGFHDRYLVIAGRRDSMHIEDRLLLAQMNRDLDSIQIITYDVLLDRILHDLNGDP